MLKENSPRSIWFSISSFDGEKSTLSLLGFLVV